MVISLKTIAHLVRNTTLVKAIHKLDNQLFGKPNSPMKILFVFNRATAAGAMFPVIEALSRREDVRVSIVDRHHSQVETPGFVELLKRHRIPLALAVLKKWHFIVSSTASIMPDLFLRDAIFLAAPHGPAFGNGPSDPTLSQIRHSRTDIMFGISRAEYEYVLRHEPKLSREKIFFPIGFAKSDELFSPSPDRQQLLRRFKLNPELKTILLASHWTRTGLLPSLGESIVSTIVNEFQDCNIIVTGHKLLWDTEWQRFKGSGSDGNFAARIEQICVQRENVRFLRPENEIDILKVADVILSDNSSIFALACLADIPVVLFDPACVYFDPEVLRIYSEASLPFRDLAELIKLVQMSLDSPHLKAPERERARNFFLANHGRATECFVNTLLALRQLPARQKSQWERARELASSLLVEG